MNATMVRLRKEARGLLAPWSALILLGALPTLKPGVESFGPFFVMRSLLIVIPRTGFLLGIPLLAALALGNEFQNRTIALWLSQPVSRLRLWGEKLAVTFAAVVSIVAVYAIGELRQPLDFPFFLAAAFVIVTASSAPYWTLVARSTIGGVVLNIFMQFWLSIPAMGTKWWKTDGPNASLKLMTVAAVYSGLMLWLGARKLARFQLTGDSASEDLVTAGPSLMPEAVARWFRPRPTGAYLNLVRREVHLLRPLLPLTALGSGGVGFQAGFDLVLKPSQPPSNTLRGALTVVSTSLVGTLGFLLGILAGSLSLGEERTSGTHSWHMTLPISVQRQWFVKLSVGLLSSVVCTVVLPLLALLAAGSLHGAPLTYVDLNALPTWLTVVSLVSLTAFWCSCAVPGTVRASIWVFPIVNIVYLSGVAGMLLGDEMASRTGTLVDMVISRFQMNPDAGRVHYDIPLEILVLAVLAFGLIQSSRLFRIQAQESLLWMLRCVLPLGLVTFLCTLGVSVGYASSRWYPFGETRRAIERLGLPDRRVEFTVNDLNGTGGIGGLTRRWLAGSTITVAPGVANPPVQKAHNITIHLATGRSCFMTASRWRSGGIIIVTVPTCTP